MMSTSDFKSPRRQSTIRTRQVLAGPLRSVADERRFKRGTSQMTNAMTTNSSKCRVRPADDPVAPSPTHRTWRRSLVTKFAAVCLVAGAIVALGPASAAFATTFAANGCTFVANTPVYEYNGRDDRSIVLNGHWSCPSAKTIELTSAAESGGNILGSQSFTWHSKTSGSWSWAEECDVNLPMYPNVNFYVKQEVGTHQGPYILGGTPTTTAYCAEFV
jgi:hypothetical protein